jgi:hypothetical protein
LAAIRRADGVLASSPSRADCIKSNYLLQRAYLEGDPQALAMFVPDERERMFAQATIHFLFWERARSARALDLWTSDALGQCMRAESSAAAGGRVDLEGARLTGSLGNRVAQTALVGRARPEPIDLIQGLLTVETHRRATRLLLVLEAWKLQHGRLPQSLDELRGTYVDRLPVDPLRGELFQYYRSGVAFSFRDTRGKTVAPGRPFLWGPTEGRLAMSRPGVLEQGAFEDSTAPSERALASGWAFAIP